MYCSNCGQELNADARFCLKCGAKIQTGALNEEEKNEQTSIVCPKCKKQNKIERVISIVKSQSRTREQIEWVTNRYIDKYGLEQSYSYPRSYDVVEITDLAKQLAPPPKPQPKSFSSCLLILGILWMGSGLLMLAISMPAGVDWNNLGRLSLPAQSLALGIIIFIAKGIYDKNQRDRIARELPLWENAIKVWNRLYYCYQDYIVFDSDDKESFCQPDQIISFCYR